jgi:demethylmenaquinone methyltransferase / 2-methoxy-6-polyprenyl-1,4-benzoquinol methylase
MSIRGGMDDENVVGVPERGQSDILSHPRHSHWEGAARRDATPMADEKVHYGFRKVDADEKERLVKGHFDVIAGRYDLADTILSFGLHHLWKRAAVRCLDLSGRETVLDLCGGTADLALAACRIRSFQGRVAVYDLNRSMMLVGRRKVEQRALRDRVDFVEGDAERISFPGDTFAKVIVGFGIRNLVHPEEGIAEVFRVLKPGGRFVCLEFSIPVNRLFRCLYEFYSRHIMPHLGRLVAGEGTPYRYLHESVRVFPSPDRFVEILGGVGFTGIEVQRLTNGIAVIYSAAKPFDYPDAA